MITLKPGWLFIILDVQTLLDRLRGRCHRRVLDMRVGPDTLKDASDSMCSVLHDRYTVASVEKVKGFMG